MILCISTNPAIDRTLVIPNFTVGKVQRAVDEWVTVGGKGLNAARAARSLGREALCMGFLAGHAGRLMTDLLENEGLQAAFTWLAQGETRTCTIVLDGAGGEPTVLNTVGPQVNAAEWEWLAGDILHYALNGTAVLFCGSLPPGAPLAEYTRLFSRLRNARCSAWVDSSRAPLAAALDAQPFAVKVNAREIGEALGMTIENCDQALQAARAVHARGIEIACITVGEHGAALVSSQGAWQACAPQVNAVNSVGSGDAFLSGLVAAVLDDLPHGEALRCGVAAGSANTLSSIAGQFAREDYLRLLGEIQVEA
ncbi:MAG: 1-phosphofructokinase family hexose kinase, partial [Chloroflexota bacterium]